MNRIKPLAISRHLRLQPGLLTCIGIFSKAINLLTARGELIVLQRRGYGISPMGVVLRSTAFNLLSQQIKTGESLRITANGIVHRLFTISFHSRRVDLSMPMATATTSATGLAKLLTHRPQLSGLCGPLASAIRQDETPWLQQLQQQLWRWLNHRPYDFTPFIGLGPGLTPSSDDMLIGLMAVLYHDRRTRQHIQQYPLFPAQQKLAQLTTHVSQGYLHRANNGQFSSTLLALMQRLQHGRGAASQIDKILALGHHSGADTLLGLYFASRWLVHFYQGSHIYA